MRYFLLIIFTIIFSSCKSQTKINLSLKKELDSILNVDQTFRRLAQNSLNSKETITFLNSQGYTFEEFQKNSWPIVSIHDKKNLKRIEEIISKYGYPSKKIIGEPTNKAIWYIIQHADKKVIQKHFPLIQKAGKEKELPMTLVAMMHDRLLMYQGKEQVYGTQGTSKEVLNLKTNKTEWISFIWPIKEPEKVNSLRKTIGFTTTIEEYAKMLDINYKVISLKEVEEKMKK